MGRAEEGVREAAVAAALVVQMARRIVSMTPTGRITVPAAARRELGISGEAEFAVAVEGDSLVLTPAVVLSRADAWAYTPEHRRRLAQAHRDSREGRVRKLTESELERLVRE